MCRLWMDTTGLNETYIPDIAQSTVFLLLTAYAFEGNIGVVGNMSVYRVRVLCDFESMFVLIKWWAPESWSLKKSPKSFAQTLSVSNANVSSPPERVYHWPGLIHAPPGFPLVAHRSKCAVSRTRQPYCDSIAFSFERLTWECGLIKVRILYYTIPPLYWQDDQVYDTINC